VILLFKMTKENVLRLLKHYEAVGRTDAYEDMKQHVLKGNKFTVEEKDALFKKPKGKTDGKK
jgi:hypothetical protein